MENRVIKFRVWNGSEMVYDVTAGKFGVFYVNPTNNGLDPNDSASITPFTTKYHDDTPLMQFTGLLDKNGKEIYEGDLVKSWNLRNVDKSPSICEVVWGRNFYAIKRVDGRGHTGLYISDGEFGVEVIGNVFENANLLEPQPVQK